MLRRFPELTASMRENPTQGAEVLDAFMLPKNSTASVVRTAGGLGLYIHRDGNPLGTMILLADAIDLVRAAQAFAAISVEA